MADASYVIPNFLGGEISKFAQGRFDKPDYRTSLNVCFNAFPVEIGAWTRRPGSRFAGTSRGGAPGRTIKFDFEQAQPYTLEFTDGFIRFRTGAALVATNDAQVVVAISTATPAVVQTTTATNWLTGNTLMFSSLGTSAPLLQNRLFLATKIDTTHFSLTDALTGANIDGSTLSALAAGATVARVQELATSYLGGAWATLRAVQAESTDILLCKTVPPQALTVPTVATPGANAIFAIAPAIFNDGPYLDPFINGVQATPSGKSGIISLTLAFPTYSATTAYSNGAFVTASGVNYISLVDQNVGNTPSSSPTFWATTSASAAINNGLGFLGTDIGRLVRLFSEPPLWLVGTTYAAGTIISYNPSGQIGATTYWQSLTGANVGHIPGSDLTNWQIIPQGAAIWTWGKITSLSNVIDRALAGSVAFGDMAGGGGVSSVFNGVFSQDPPSSAEFGVTGGTILSGNFVSIDCHVGKNYTGATSQRIQQATIYPPSSLGFCFGSYVTYPSGAPVAFQPTVTLNLRGKATAPTTASDGTLLGTTGQISNTGSAVTIISSDTTTAWNYVWVEMSTLSLVLTNSTSYSFFNVIGQVSFFGPPGIGTSAGVNIEILGPPLLYTNPILTWRLGVYSNTTGWPTCGTYHEGRLWLGGAMPNRFDGCVSNGILGGTVNFAPTDQYGVVAANSAISYVLNSDSVNPIFWMEPDLQGIIMGTQAAEWLAQAPSTGPMAPTNIAARRVTKIGCANIEPRRTEHTSVFVQRFSQKLMEYFSDVYSGKFSAPNIADKAQHITSAGIAELAYQQAVTPIIWGRDDAGSLFGITYKRDTLTTAQGPTFAGWHRHQLGSGRIVESICSGPSIGGNLDSLTMVTNDAATNVRHVEVMTDTMDENSALTDAWFLDGAVAPTSTVSSDTASVPAPYGGLTLNGLWHLNGKTATVFAGGLDCGDFLITNGSCFVSYGDSVSAGTGGGLFTAAFVASFAAGCPIVVGFSYASRGQTVRPVAPGDTGARNGPGFGKKRRGHRYAMLLTNTLGLSVGATFDKMFPANFRQPNNKAIEPLTMFSGTHEDTLQDDYSYDGMICWEVSRPYPATVVAMGGNLQTQDQ